MQETIALQLINELKRRLTFIEIKKNFFLNSLIKTNIPQQSTSYESVYSNTQIIEETDRHFYISLTYIINNKNPSVLLTKTNKRFLDLVKIIKNSQEPFSAIGELTTYDFNKKTNFIITKPIFILPNQTSDKEIDNWEKTNTIYKKEFTIIGLIPIIRKITSQEYYSH